jgi:peptidoglycan hydrolase CwlO-like protein
MVTKGGKMASLNCKIVMDEARVQEIKEDLTSRFTDTLKELLGQLETIKKEVEKQNARIKELEKENAELTEEIDNLRHSTRSMED